MCMADERPVRYRWLMLRDGVEHDHSSTTCARGERRSLRRDASFKRALRDPKFGLRRHPLHGGEDLVLIVRLSEKYAALG